MKRNLILLTIAIACIGCGTTHHGTLVVYDADSVTVKNAVLANRSNAAISAMTTTESGTANPDGVFMGSGVILINPGEVKIERIIGWNWGIEGIDVGETMKQFTEQ